MNWSMLGAADRRNLILGAIVVVTGVLSFLDPGVDWGSVVFLGILGGLLAIFLAIRPQVAPTARLPASEGIVLLVAGALAAGGFVLAGLTYVNGVFDVNAFSIIFDLGLIASVILLWFGWRAYQAEQAKPDPSSPPAPPTAPPAPPAT